MKRASRALAVAVTAAALTLTGAVEVAASAKPHAVAHAKGGHAKTTPAKGEVRKVLRDIARLTTALDRNVRPSRIGTLPEDQQAAVLANVALDKQALTDLATAASAADTTLDLRQVRKDLKKVRPENYLLSVNVLRGAAGLAEAAAANAEAAALVDSAVATAQTVTATSPKSLVKEARAALAAAEDLLAPDEEEPEPTTDPTDPAAPVQG